MECTHTVDLAVAPIVVHTAPLMLSARLANSATFLIKEALGRVEAAIVQLDARVHLG